MAFASYDELMADVAKYLKRQDLTAIIPDFVMFAESYFDKNIYVNARRTSFVSTPTANVFSTPSDMKKAIQAYYLGRILDFFPLGFESTYAGGDGNVIAHGWQLMGNQITLSVPQLGQIFQLDYYTILEGLSSTNESNWLLEDAPEVYLAGVLHEAFSYVRDEERAGYWLQKRDAAIQSYIDDDTAKRSPAAQLTIRAG